MISEPEQPVPVVGEVGLVKNPTAASGMLVEAVTFVVSPPWLGEARYLGWTLARGVGNRTWRGVLTGVLDPFGELERWAGTKC